MFDLSDELSDKKIVDFTDEELLAARFIGDGESLDAPERVKQTVAKIKEDPELLGFLTGFELECQRITPEDTAEAQLSPTLSGTSTLHSRVSVSSSATSLTVADGEYVSEFEKYNYYVGTCANDEDVPLLYFRTSSKSAPFALPAPGDRWFTIPNKIVHGPWDKVLTKELWNTVAPQIISRVLDTRGIKYQSLMAVRFSSPNATGKVTLGPIIIWIGTHAGTTTPDTAHNVSPDILSILGEHGINGAEVEWYEARV